MNSGRGDKCLHRSVKGVRFFFLPEHLRLGCERLLRRNAPIDRQIMWVRFLHSTFMQEIARSSFNFILGANELRPSIPPSRSPVDSRIDAESHTQPGFVHAETGLPFFSRSHVPSCGRPAVTLPRPPRLPISRRCISVTPRRCVSGAPLIAPRCLSRYEHGSRGPTQPWPLNVRVCIQAHEQVLTAQLQAVSAHGETRPTPDWGPARGFRV